MTESIHYHRALLEFPAIPRIPSLRHTHTRNKKQWSFVAGREFLAIPGPTTMPDEVLRRCIVRRWISTSEQMLDMTDSLLRISRRLFATKGRTYIYIANGHGAWEAVLSNVFVARRTRFWCWRAAASPSAGARRRRDGCQGR